MTGRDDLWRVNPNLPPAVDLVRNTLINRVQYDTDSLRLVGINGLVALRQDAFADRDATEVARTQEFRSTDLDQLSSEWQLSSRRVGPVDWLAGIYLSQNQIDNNRVFQNLSDREIHFNSESSGASRAIYSHVKATLSDSVDITTGARYTYERRELFAESARVPANAGIPFDAVAGLGEQGAEYFLLLDGGERRDASWDNLSGELGLHWQFRPEFALFGSVSSGFKSGGYSGSFTISTSPPGSENRFEPYKPERTVQTEIGLRGTTLDKAFQYELAAYHIDLSDRVEQVLVFDPSSENGNAARLVNAARAQIDGVDVNFVWTPTTRLTVQAALAWMDARYTRYLIYPDDPGNQLARDNNRSGFRLPQAPEVSAFLSVSDRIPLQRFGDLELGVAAEYTSSQFFNSRNARVVGQPGYALVHFSLSWQSADGKTTVGTYIDNVTNEKYAIYGTDEVDGVNLLTAGKQRSWRISFSYRF